MTVCIGAICNNRQAAVVASDRMVTSHLPPIEFEHTKSKIFELTEYCLALVAGNALKPIELIPKIRAKLTKTKNPNIEFIAENIKELYQYLRANVAEDSVLRPRTIDKETFYTRGINIFPPDLFNLIDHQFINYDYGLEMLIVGVDSIGSHIYSVRNPGKIDCFDTIGFHAIGVGYLHASQSFIAHRYTESYDVEEALSVVYAAKRAAEVAPGVGSETDMSVIISGNIIVVDKEIIKELSKIYDEVHKTPAEEMAERSKRLKDLIAERIKTQKDQNENENNATNNTDEETKENNQDGKDH